MTGVAIPLSVVGSALLGGYLISAPGLVFLQRRRLTNRSTWFLPLSVFLLWFVLLVSFGPRTGWNILEAFLIMGVVGAIVTVAALWMASNRNHARWSSALFWATPHVIVLVLRAAMPELGE